MLKSLQRQLVVALLLAIIASPVFAAEHDTRTVYDLLESIADWAEDLVESLLGGEVQVLEAASSGSDQTEPPQENYGPIMIPEG